MLTNGMKSSMIGKKSRGLGDNLDNNLELAIILSSLRAPLGGAWQSQVHCLPTGIATSLADSLLAMTIAKAPPDGGAFRVRGLLQRWGLGGLAGFLVGRGGHFLGLPLQTLVLFGQVLLGRFQLDIELIALGPNVPNGLQV